MSELKKTPLFDFHQKAKANMVPFAGFYMPVYYTSIKEEYYQTRENVATFDISHMSPISLSSENPLAIKEMIQYLTPRNLKEMIPGKIYYNAFLNENGGIKDDVTLYFIDNHHMIIIANAINGEKITNYLNEWIDKKFKGIHIKHLQDYIFFALQGKKAETILRNIFNQLSYPYEDLSYYSFARLDDGFAFYSRTGYTGEDGFEILLPKKQGIAAWEASIHAGATPAGLGARDILRMEMFYPLYGHELNEDLTPLESGLSFITSKDKDYLGKEKIWNKVSSKKLIKFTLEEKGIPREKMTIINKDNQSIGHVTSGGFSFQWNCGFGMALINEEEYLEELKIIIRDKTIPIKIHKKRPYSGSIKQS